MNLTTTWLRYWGLLLRVLVGLRERRKTHLIKNTSIQFYSIHPLSTAIIIKAGAKIRSEINAKRI